MALVLPVIEFKKFVTKTLSKPLFIMKLLWAIKQEAMKTSCFSTSSTFLCFLGVKVSS